MKFNFFSIVIFAFCTVFMACSDNTDSNTSYGRMSVKLTDAPFQYDLVAEANVTIFKIEARYKGDVLVADMEGVVHDGTDGSSYITLMEEEIQVNLLELTNGLTETLVNAEVPVGSYDLIRVYVKGVGVVLTDGTSYDLKVPSGEQTGIKIFVKPELVVNGGLTADLLLDFDVSKSFVAKGNSNDLMGITGFNFKPVIKASNMSVAGTLAGRVTTLQEEVAVGLEGVQVAVYSGDLLNTTTFTDAEGNYTVLGLDAGAYTVVVELATYQMQTVGDIVIVAANKAVLDFELLAQ